MISVEEAQKIISEHTRRKAPVRVCLEDSLGLVLAEDIRATTDLPPFTNSAMDGYALRSKDSQEASSVSPRSLKVIEDLPAGRIPRKEIIQGTCAQIMTGAFLPKGADSIIPVEATERIGEEVNIKQPVSRGENVRFQGEDVKEGKIFLGGIPIRPQEIALLAALGRSSVLVFPPANVAILSTGDELIPVSKKLPPGKLRNSNSPALAALLKREGAIPISLGIARDSLESLREKIKKGLKSDILLVAGGISVGTHDLVKKVFEEMSVRELFWKVRMKPGKPIFFGKKGGTLVFGLPGNPASSFVSFEIFVRLAVRLKMGHPDALPAYQKAALLHNLTHRKERVEFIRAAATRQNGTLFVRSSGMQGSHCLSSLCQANALIRLGEDTSRAAQGEEVDVLML